MRSDRVPGTALGIGMNVTSEKQMGEGCSSPMPVSRSPIRSSTFPFADGRTLFWIHLDGAFLSARARLPHFYAAGQGAIISMGSVQDVLNQIMLGPALLLRAATAGGTGAALHL